MKDDELDRLPVEKKISSIYLKKYDTDYNIAHLYDIDGELYSDWHGRNIIKVAKQDFAQEFCAPSCYITINGSIRGEQNFPTLVTFKKGEIVPIGRGIKSDNYSKIEILPVYYEKIPTQFKWGSMYKVKNREDFSLFSFAKKSAK